MKDRFKGFRKIFSFTFIQHVKSRGYRTSTISVFIACLLLPALIMTAVQLASSDGTEAAFEAESGAAGEGYVQEEYTELGHLSEIKRIISVDESAVRRLDLKPLAEAFAQLTGSAAETADMGDDFDRARKESAGSDDTVILFTTQQGDNYSISVILPDDSGLSEEAAYEFQSVLDAYTAETAAYLNGYGAEDTGGAAEPGGDEQPAGEDGEETAESQAQDARDIAAMIFSYLNIMILYFFVLAYGQGVANSVVMEKSSRLMETMLISVRPAAMILGKLLAVTVAGIMQLFLWLAGLAASFAAGTVIARSIDPETDMMIIDVFRLIKTVSQNMFTPASCILTLLLIAAGMLLYCALAGIGGALAGKTEDLSSTNVIFTMVLVVSFFGALLGGGLGMDGEAAGWLDWVPFTAVMVTPARTLLGLIPPWKSLASLAVTAAAILLITALAGRLYENFVLYRGSRLRPAAALKILKKNKGGAA